MKILVFTDSRGQHKPAGSKHLIFGERLLEELKDDEVDLVLCPMKWTTTLDFFDYAEKNDLISYDWIILYTGIVEWSPRPASSAYNDLYCNVNEVNKGYYTNTRDYSKKIVNNKKQLFDNLFSEDDITHYLKNPTPTLYEGEKTINMYSLSMAKQSVIPELKKYSNLIFISSNRILEDWDGDFKRGRPKNISMIHEYTEEFVKKLPKDRVIDLGKWDKDDIKRYTCDNMHLTKQGSDYIFGAIMNIISYSTKSEILNQSKVSKFKHLLSRLSPFNG